MGELAGGNLAEPGKGGLRAAGGARCVLGALYLGERAVRPDGMAPPPMLDYVPADAAGDPVPGATHKQAAFQPNPIYRAPVGEEGPRVVFLIPFTPPPGQNDWPSSSARRRACKRSSSTAR